MKRAILVKSCQCFRGRREACERTWIRKLRSPQVPVFAVTGGHHQEGFKAHYNRECELHVQAGDRYEEIHIKLREAIRLLMCISQFDSLFVVDDDTFVHPRRWLAHEPAGELECRVFWPHTAQQLQSNDRQPWITGGSGWWMSRRLCQLYVEECQDGQRYDDIILANLAARHGIAMIDRPDLYGSDGYSEEVQRVAGDNDLITSHHVQPSEMVTLWEATKTL